MITKIKQKKITSAPPPISPLPVGPVTMTPDRGTMTNKEYRAGRGLNQKPYRNTLYKAKAE